MKGIPYPAEVSLVVGNLKWWVRRMLQMEIQIAASYVYQFVDRLWAWWKIVIKGLPSKCPGLVLLWDPELVLCHEWHVLVLHWKLNTSHNSWHWKEWPETHLALRNGKSSLRGKITWEFESCLQALEQL